MAYLKNKSVVAADLSRDAAARMARKRAIESILNRRASAPIRTAAELVASRKLGRV